MNRLSDLIEKYSDLPPQGSEFWLENRKHTFGGSEVATIIGINPYQSLKKLIKVKVEHEYNDCLPFCWGRHFEDVSLEILKANYDVHHFGAIPHEDGTICYSPDGVIVIDDELVLIEIKCPLWRIVQGGVPIHYMPQVLSGIDALNCDYGLFIDNEFRKCALEDFGFNPRFNTSFHRSKRDIRDVEPIIIGLLVWAGVGVVDIGSMGITDTAIITTLGKPDIYTWKHHEWRGIPPEFWTTIGYVLPFKLIRSVETCVQKQPRYISSLKAPIDRAVEMLEAAWDAKVFIL